MITLFEKIRVSWIPELFALITQGFLLWKIAPLQVDPHHDGIILGAAIATSDGRYGNSGAFTQYGPISPLIQGIFLRFTENSEIALRYFTALQCLLIAILIYFLIRELFSRIDGLIASVYWVFASAIWTTSFPGALLPWPSILSTLVLLIAFIFLIKLASNETRFAKIHNSLLVSSGFLIGIAGFIRIQSFLALPLILIALYAHRKSSPLRFIPIILGTSLGVASVIFWLIAIGSWNSFVYQVLILPFLNYTGLGNGNNYNRFQMAMYLLEAVLFSMVIYIISHTRKFVRNINFTLLIVFILGLVVLKTGVWITHQNNWPTIFRVGFGEPLDRIVTSPMYFGSFSVIIFSFLYLFRKPRLWLDLDLRESLCIAFGIVGVVQLYPQSDVLHLWWIAPLVLPTSWIVVKKIGKVFNTIQVADYRIAISAFAMIGVSLAAVFISQPWSEYKLPILRGTYASKDKVEAINFYRKMEPFLVQGHTSFDCPDGVYSVLNGRYLPPDEWFVNWDIFPKDLQTNKGTIRILCNKSAEYIDSESKRLDMKLVKYELFEKYKESYAVLHK